MFLVCGAAESLTGIRFLQDILARGSGYVAGIKKLFKTSTPRR